jgi:hypothetical protein
MTLLEATVSVATDTHGYPRTFPLLLSRLGVSLLERTGAPAMREVRHGYPRTFPLLLSRLGVSLLVPTHHAGKVVAVGVARGELTLSYHNFERAMGLDVKRSCERRSCRRGRPTA